MNWIALDFPNHLAQITERSHQVPCLIFKHSTRCSISSVAKYRLESDWSFSTDMLAPYFLDLIAYREISNGVAAEFNIHHESPQILLIWRGECVFDTSHLDISVEAIEKALPYSRVD